MKSALLVAAFLSLAVSGYAAETKMPATEAKRVILTPDKLQWSQGPAQIPNSQMAVLEGNPAKSGFFALRLKLPAGTKIGAHYHENVERVTVISGAISLAMGTGKENPTVLPAGSYFALAPKLVHNAWVDEETVLQIATRGPWSLKTVKSTEK